MALREDVGERARQRVGSVIRAKWRLDGVIGIGGMACVYSATHRNQSRVAIKMLHPEVALDADVTARFLREGYVANAVRHPGTVKVLDDDVTEDGAPFLVMELLDGETLDARLARLGTLPVQEVAAIGAQLLDVLAAAHERDIVHRDLKPDNLFLTREGLLKVLDFGIARLREPHSGSGTRAGSVLGTPAFMAPEQALGRWNEVDGRTDIWAVGATLFTLLSGRHVHEGDTVQEELVLAATQPAPPLQTVVPDAPSDFASVLDRALRFEMKERFRDARSMHAALSAVLPTDALLTVPGTSLTPLFGSQVAARSMEEDSTLAAASSQEPSETLANAQAMTRSAPQSIAREGRNRFMLVAFGVLAAGVLIALGRWSNEASISPSVAGSSLPPVAPLEAPQTPPVTQPSAARVEPVDLPTPAEHESASPAPSSRPKIRSGRSRPVTAAKTPATKKVDAPQSNPFDLRK
ncbi:MAG TPA: protein kinase [Polyangiaceae bacterium]|nr:protein kinase [Polyangiaceae bacterium]